MIRGLYTSAWGLLATSKKMDVISNNMANANTTAYKKDIAVFESFPAMLTKRINDTQSLLSPLGNVGDMEFGSDIGEVYTNYIPGQTVKTGNNLDMAIQDDNADPSQANIGKSFFTLAVPGQDGNITEYLTRDGSFTLSAQRQLVSKDGYPVMGVNGPITLRSEDFRVDANGNIIENDVITNRLIIRQFADTTVLRKFGNNLVEVPEDAEEQPFTGNVLQGYLEQSNVNVVREMVDMISVLRSYEANQKILQYQDSTLEKVVNEVGAVR